MARCGSRAIQYRALSRIVRDLLGRVNGRAQRDTTGWQHCMPPPCIGVIGCARNQARGDPFARSAWGRVGRAVAEPTRGGRHDVRSPSRARRRASATAEPASARAPDSQSGQVEGRAQGAKALGFLCRSSRVPPGIGVPATREIDQAARRTEGTTCRVCDGFTAVGLTGFICTSLLSVAHISADNLVHNTRHILHDNP